MSGGLAQVSVSNVSRHYGRRRVLAQVSLTIHAGDVLALLGANGVGKSTLLAILATSLRPSSGDVRYDRRTAGEHGPELRARIGLLAHDLYLYPELSARENLVFFGSLYGMDGIDRRVASALERADLARRADDPVGTFSRGMRQRLALERALLHEPDLVLLDEPFTGLDQRSSDALRVRLGELRASGRMVVVATHDLGIAEETSSRTVLLKNGAAFPLDGGPGTLQARYREAMG